MLLLLRDTAGIHRDDDFVCDAIVVGYNALLLFDY